MLFVNCIYPGVGGIEAEAVMLGQPISMVLPVVIGYKLVGTPHHLVTSTDIVLTVTKVCLGKMRFLFFFFFSLLFLKVAITVHKF